MKRFLREQNGSALIWTLFIILALFTISFAVYSGVTVYAKYQSAETELQRSAIVTVEKSMVNVNVRDLVLNVPSTTAIDMLETNLIDAGWIKEDADWVKRDGEKLIYGLEDMQIEIADMTMQMDATFAMPLPWAIKDIGYVRIPMQIRTSILYVNQEGGL